MLFIHVAGLASKPDRAAAVHIALDRDKLRVKSSALRSQTAQDPKLLSAIISCHAVLCLYTFNCHNGTMYYCIESNWYLCENNQKDFKRIK